MPTTPSPATDSVIEKIPARKIRSIRRDPEKTAAAINLVYVHDNQPGILRVKSGKQFHYYFNDKKITAKAELERIKSLVLPPAWENVWICPNPDGHLQATGLDALKRKQYRYHPLWNRMRSHTKFYQLLEFAKVLPAIRTQMQKDLALEGLPLDKVLALMVSLMEKTNIRVGNNFYEKLYGSFGLTTLKNRHVNIHGNELAFFFRGKKGVEHRISFKSKKLAVLVKQCRDLPGKELFQYIDEAGQRKPVDSGMVNNYIKKISGADFSAKDFRTWTGSLDAFVAFREMGEPENEADRKRKIVEVMDRVSGNLGNTRNVCRKYYVHPQLICLYENDSFNKSLAKAASKNDTTVNEALHPDEREMIMVLEANV